MAQDITSVMLDVDSATVLPQKYMDMLRSPATEGLCLVKVSFIREPRGHGVLLVFLRSNDWLYRRDSR